MLHDTVSPGVFNSGSGPVLEGQFCSNTVVVSAKLQFDLAVSCMLLSVVAEQFGVVH